MNMSVVGLGYVTGRTFNYIKHNLGYLHTEAYICRPNILAVGLQPMYS